MVCWTADIFENMNAQKLSLLEKWVVTPWEWYLLLLPVKLDQDSNSYRYHHSQKHWFRTWQCVYNWLSILVIHETLHYFTPINFSQHACGRLSIPFSFNLSLFLKQFIFSKSIPSEQLSKMLLTELLLYFPLFILTPFFYSNNHIGNIHNI